MEIRVRLFASQRQLVGARELRLELPDGATVGEAWQALVGRHPALEPGGASVRFARNAAYSDPGEQLVDGDELAVIPPVAGGSTPAAADSDPAANGPRVRRIELRADPIDDALLGELRAAVSTAADGAVAVFVGQTRESPGTPAPGQEAEAARFAGQSVKELEYEAFEELAVGVLGQIADEIERRFGVRRLAIVHRTGHVGLGDASVVIAAASPHRAAAFDACRYAIEELKARAPIWKSERFTGGGVWIGAPARTGPVEEEQG
jgi:molybdopterin synthase catalytic subunit